MVLGRSQANLDAIPMSKAAGRSRPTASVILQRTGDDWFRALGRPHAAARNTSILESWQKIEVVFEGGVLRVTLPLVYRHR